MPLFGLIPINLLIHPRWALSAIPAILMVLWLYMDWQLRAWDDTDAPTLVVMTNNVGQNNKQSMRPFLNAHGPTIIALQEAGRKAAFERDYPEWKVEAWGEFTLLSKHPIISVTPIEDAKWQDQVVAVRFVVDWDGTKIAVYNVHLPSPRDEIKALTGKPLALGMIGFGPLKDKRIAYHQPWLDRVATSKQLAHMVDSDNLPALLVGDLNFPNHGAAYHAVTETLIDAFEEKGKGYGFTFPGTNRNPLTGFGPWIRIDYLFTNDRWATLKAVSEQDRKSQHRAVAASFTLSDPSE